VSGRTVAEVSVRILKESASSAISKSSPLAKLGCSTASLNNAINAIIGMLRALVLDGNMAPTPVPTAKTPSDCVVLARFFRLLNHAL
jgi:hypothetical protein